MTLEEMAEEYANKVHTKYFVNEVRYNTIQAYIAGYKQVQEQIKIREQEKCELLGIIQAKDNQIEELEESLECAEHNCKVKQEYNDKQYQYGLKILEQLDKAKDLILNIVRVTWGEGWNYSLDWKVKADEFLKEGEE